MITDVSQTTTSTTQTHYVKDLNALLVKTNIGKDFEKYLKKVFFHFVRKYKIAALLPNNLQIYLQVQKTALTEFIPDINDKFIK